MAMQDSSFVCLELEAALDPRPLTVAADTSVAEAIATLGKAQSSCNLPGLELSLNTVLAIQARAGAIWVTDGEMLLGQFTEADALREIAAGRGTSTELIRNVMKPVSMSYPLTPEADPFDALDTLRQNHLYQLPVVNDGGTLLGVITPERLRGMLHLDILLKDQPVERVMQGQVVTAAADETVQALAQRLLNQPTDVLIVTASGDNSTPLGLLLARDIIQLQCLGADLTQIQAVRVMQRPPLIVAPGVSALEAYWLMQQHQTQRFIVGQGLTEVLGTVSPISFLYSLNLAQMVQAHGGWRGMLSTCCGNS